MFPLGLKKFGVILGVVLLVCCIVGLYLLLNGKRKPEKDDYIIFEPVPLNEKTHVQYLTQLVNHRYQQYIRTYDRPFLKTYFTGQLKKINERNLQHFFTYLGTEFPATLPLREHAKLDILDAITEDVHLIKNWLSVVEEEEKLWSSYEYQVQGRQDGKNKGDEWTDWQRTFMAGLNGNYSKKTEILEQNNSLYFFRMVILLSDVNNKLRELDKKYSQVTITATIIYLDADIIKNVNLAIIASDWRFIRPVTFDLRGSHAVDLNGSQNDGAPGLTGSHGGHFLGIGNFNQSRITVLTDGGNGGDGHIGVNGRNGISNLKPDRNAIPNPRCATVSIPEGSNLGQLITYYAVYHEYTCHTAGGEGGEGGLPGLGGVAIFITNNITEIKAGKNGTKGLKGKHGPNGTPAKIVCNFTAIKAKEKNNPSREHWSELTKTICFNNITLPIQKTIQNKSEEAKQVPQLDTSVFSSAINAFSKDARWALLQINDRRMFSLLKTVEQNKVLNNLTNIPTLLQQPKWFSKETSNSETLESFLGKVKNILSERKDSQEREALNYLLASILSQISTISSDYSDYYIVNLAGFIDIVLEDINDINIDNVFNRAKDGALDLVQELSTTKMTELYNFTQTSLIPTLKKLEETEKWERRILSLSIMISQSVLMLISFTIATVQGNIADLTQLNNVLLHAYEIQKLYYQGLHLAQDKDNEVFQACAEMFFDEAQCKNSGQRSKPWESFKEMDESILAVLQFPHENTGDQQILHAVENILTTILESLRSDLAMTSEVETAVDDLRSILSDLKLLVVRYQQINAQVNLNKILKRLNHDFVFKNVEISHAVTDLKYGILNNMVRSKYEKVFSAYRQWSYPYDGKRISLLPPNATKEEMLQSIKEIKNTIATYKTTIQEKDFYTKEAEFTLTSNIGPFYTWLNTDYRKSIKDLLSGRKVLFRADIHNCPHIPNKQAIKFRKAEFFFSGPIQKVIGNFAVQMVHTGFSKYFFHGEIQTAISPAINIYYSLTNNAHNNVYKKLKQGDITLSPYATWEVQLQKVNDAAVFGVLEQYVNTTHLHLVGTGLYTTEEIPKYQNLKMGR